MSLSLLFSRETHDLRHKCTSLTQAYDQASAKCDTLSQALTQEKDEHNEAITSKERALRALSQENLALQERVATLENQLQACTDDLFRLQPLSQVPDSMIAQRLEDLNVQICDWIAVEISRSMDEHENVGGPLKLFHHGKNRHAKAFLAEYPEFGGEYYVRSVLQQHLQQVLFDDRLLLFALDRSSSKLLQAIEHGMFQLRPSREAATIRGWRSEALASIVKTPEFSAHLRQATVQLAEESYEILGSVFPVISNHRISLGTLYEKVIKLAVDIAITMQTSLTTYHFDNRAPSATPFVTYSVSKLSLGRTQLIDVETRKPLKPDSLILSDSSGNIGDRIMTLSPALYRRNKGNSVLLSQEIILVKLYKPLGRRHAKKEPVSEQLG